MTVHFRVDYGGNNPIFERTPQGGILAKANLTRTGVLTYLNQDGTTRRELRHPDEVFAPASLATLRAAPLTLRHPAEPVTARNYQTLAKGHVGEDVRADGRFVAASIRAQSADVVEAIDAGTLREFSCGYHCVLDETPGEYEGERYDAVQRTIRYNHVGIGPAGWGRAGAEVALRHDGEARSYSRTMTLEEALAAIAALNKRNDELTARLDTATERADALDKRAPDEAVISARVDARLALLEGAREVLGVEGAAKVKGTDRDVKVACIVARKPDFKADGRSDDYVNARFDAIVEDVRASRKSSNDVRQDAAKVVATGTVKVDDGRAAMIARNANAWKVPS